MNQVIGGIIIGAAATIMLMFLGRVTGISGILAGILNIDTYDKGWRVSFIAGLLLGGVILRFTYPEAFTLISTASTIDYIIAGLLVGFGTVLGSGCTSGHGVCGISRLSARSLMATVVFIVSGVVSVALFKMIRGEL